MLLSGLALNEWKAIYFETTFIFLSAQNKKSLTEKSNQTCVKMIFVIELPLN